MTPSVIVARGLRGRIAPSVPRELCRRLRRAGQRLRLSGDLLRSLHVRLVDDTEMAALHQAHMSLSGPTDVMSFPAASIPALPGDDSEGGEMGDIVIDWDAVARQAASLRPRDLLDEAVALAVHGLVHLLGHDHRTRPEARAMLRLERRASRAARLPPLWRPYGGGY